MLTSKLSIGKRILKNPTSSTQQNNLVCYSFALFGSCFIKTTSQESCTRTFFLKITLINRIKNRNSNLRNPPASDREVYNHSLPNQYRIEIRTLGDLQGLLSAPTRVLEVHTLRKHLIWELRKEAKNIWPSFKNVTFDNQWLNLCISAMTVEYPSITTPTSEWYIDYRQQRSKRSNFFSLYCTIFCSCKTW